MCVCDITYPRISLLDGKLEEPFSTSIFPSVSSPSCKFAGEPYWVKTWPEIVGLLNQTLMRLFNSVASGGADGVFMRKVDGVFCPIPLLGVWAIIARQQTRANGLPFFFCSCSALFETPSRKYVIVDVKESFRSMKIRFE